MAENLSDLTFDKVFTSSTGKPLPPSIPLSPSKTNHLPRTKDIAAFLRKTPLMIFEEGCKGTYQENAVWHTQEIPGKVGVEFELTLSVRGIAAKGKANSKKVAKQKAAVAYLHEAVRKGKMEDFFLPGDNEEEAHGYIDQIDGQCDEQRRSVTKIEGTTEGGLDADVPTCAKIPDDLASQNWVGRLQEKAQKQKMAAPLYEERSLSSGKFATYCLMCKQKTCGVGSTKKAAKNAAAYLMLKMLEEGLDAIEADMFGDELDEIQEEERLVAVRKQAFAEVDKKGALETILSDKRKFAEYSMNFYYESVNGAGTHQVLLQVETTRPVSPDADDLQVGAEHTQTAEIQKAAAAKEEEKKNLPETGKKVFSGHGNTPEEAHDSAYQAAIIHFNTYSPLDV